MAELVADAALLPAGNAPTSFFRNAVSVSIVLHAMLIGGASVALSWPQDMEDSGVEAIAVDIVTLEQFSATTTTTSVQSSATDAMQSAGVQSVATTAPTPVPVEQSVETVEAITAEAATAAETTAPVQVVPTAVTPVAEAVASVQPLAVAASPVPSVETVAPVETGAATAVPVTPVETAQPVAEHVPSLTAETVEPLPDDEPKAAKAEKPVEKPKKEAKPKKKPAAASIGNGGKSDADAAAANSAASGKGKSGNAGNAAVDKYPGIVQRQLRRALRFPKGAGRARGEVHVQFVVSASGGASRISVVKSSGEPVIDQAAIATVERAAPFPPIPPEAGRSSWTFTIPLRFSR